MIFIGESINASIKSVAEAIIKRDEEFIKNLAKVQAENGANYLDVNAAIGGRNEVEDLTWTINMIQEVVDLPLALDSSNSEALVTVYDLCKYEPIINSISMEQKKRDTLLPIIREKKCGVIALCLEDGGMPKTIEDRLSVAEKLMQELNFLPPEKIFLDPLVLAISTDNEAGRTVLLTLEKILEKYPDVHTTGGVSNVSFGLPARKLLNRTFMAMAIDRGMDTAIIDVRDRALMSIIYAAEALCGRDRFCMNYLKQYRAENLTW